MKHWLLLALLAIGCRDAMAEYSSCGASGIGSFGCSRDVVTGGGGGPATLDPTEVSDLVDWWRPDTTVYEDGSCTDAAEDGDTVMCVAAKSGSGLIGPLLVGNAPIFNSGGGPNGTDRIRFDPTGDNGTDYLQYNPADIAVPVSIGMIVEFAVTQDNGDVLFDGQGPCGAGRLQVYADAGLDTHMFDVPGGEDFDTANSTAFGGGTGVTLLMFTWDGVSSDYYLDSGTPTATGDAGTSGLANFKIGGNCANTAFVNMRFELMDLWIHSDDYTTEEAEGLCEYGNDRYTAGWTC